MKKSVSIIILNYNGNQDTIDCLKSLKNQTFKNFEILLVDNGSNTNSFLELKRELKQFKEDLEIILIRINLNVFFTGGNNKALKIASGEYICLLNNDTIVSPDFIERMVDFLEKNSDAGMISPKIKVYKNKNYLWYAGAYLNLKKATISGLRGIWEFDPQNQKYNEIILTDYAAGTALFLKKEVVDKIGLLDEIFFMYFEETDWNLRAKKEGYKVYYVPTTIVYHKVSPINNKKASRLKHLFFNRNAQILVWKHAKFIELLIFYLNYSIRNLKLIFKTFINKELYYVYLQFYSLLQGFRIGIKRRSNRSCHKIIVKDYHFFKHIEKRKELF
ncbi:MAG: glycosyltransferase family 2 protein [Promethearchaeota archaeon]